MALIGYFGINAVLISFAYILVFIVEKTFGLVSVMTLVELSDINNRTLRELSRECPGTFQHSMAVSNLATEAAHRIGANVQLVRAGALYHDIGKIDNPAFFTENQYGVNPHDTLTPAQSARIITRHVSDACAGPSASSSPRPCATSSPSIMAAAKPNTSIPWSAANTPTARSTRNHSPTRAPTRRRARHPSS